MKKQFNTLSLYDEGIEGIVNDWIKTDPEFLSDLTIEIREKIKEGEIIDQKSFINAMIEYLNESKFRIKEGFDEDEIGQDICVCSDCQKKFKKGDEGDNEKVCLRCEANFIAEKKFDWESGFNDEEE